MQSGARGALLGLALVVGLAAPGVAAAAPPSSGGTLDVRGWGAAGDGTADDTAAFERALAEIGSAPATLLLAGGAFSVGSLAFPANVTIRFAGGGQLRVAPGGMVAIHGAIEAGLGQVFSGEGAVAGRIANLQVVPQWFGARGDGAHDDGPALQKAADLAAGSLGRTLFIPDGSYLYRSHVTFRCHIESRGLLVREIAIDESRTVSPPGSPLPTHYPTQEAIIRFMPDSEALELAAEPFLGVREGSFSVPIAKGVPLASGEGAVDLAEGGTLRFYSSDFFSSRYNGKGDEYYDRNDIMQIVTGMGDVFPEFAFSYDRPPEAEGWSAEGSYAKGDYVRHKDEIFKATWPSGPGSGYVHPHLGPVTFGQVEPDPAAATTVHRFTYPGGARDSIGVWRRVRTQVWYREKDAPLTVNGLRVEVRLAENAGDHRRIQSGAVVVARSNMTFNALEVRVRDREAMMSQLVNVSGCVNVTFNNARVSGATFHGLGYNLLNSNAANIRYIDCVSTNSRKGIDGRHGKNITVRGGHYNVIEDHYGRNLSIRDAVMSGLSTHIPGYMTPAVDLPKWSFVPRRPFGFSGANLHIENCVVDRAEGGIFGVRGDIGDLYGTVVIKGISVRRNVGDVSVFSHRISADFDYAHPVRSPDALIIEDVVLENPGRLLMDLGTGFPAGRYGAVQVRGIGPIGQVQSSSREAGFLNCRFDGARFALAPEAWVSFATCVFAGATTGLSERQVALATGNAASREAILLFPLEYRNPERHADNEEILRRSRAFREILDRWSLLPDVPKEVYAPVLDLQGDTRVVEDGPAGAALVIPFVDTERVQGAVVRRDASLFPEGAFSLEVAVKPGDRFHEKLADSRWGHRACLVDTMAVDYVHQNLAVECKQGYQMELRRADGGGVRVAVSLGFGRDEELAVFQTEPLPFSPGEWYHVLFAYDGKGTGRITVNGASAAQATYAGRAGIVPSQRHGMHIGERATSTYRSFPGAIGLVRLHHRSVPGEAE